MENALILKEENIAKHIYFIRGEKVMLDFDLAILYEVETRVLKQQIRRNIDRFPSDFMFQLTKNEWNELITNCDNLIGKYKYSPSLPYAFTEQGVAMLSSILRSKRALQVNIAIMRTFVQLRKLIDVNKDIAKKVEKLEAKYDEQFKIIFKVIKQLMVKKPVERRPIGYKIYNKDNNNKKN